MSPDSSTGLDSFLQLAVKLSLLPADTAERLAIEAQDRRLHVSQLVLQRGLLSPVQIDIVETLLRPDEVVPGLELLSVIGHGGMGVVYRARQKNLNRIVAVKTVLVHQMADPSIIQRFENEAQAVARLAHPHIVAAYDFGQHEGRLYFVMEFVEGEDVQKLIRRQGPLDEAITWGLIRQAAAGLSHAVQVGIVHRDIKPANLLLVAPPAGFPLPPGMPLVKIADFGLARITTEGDDRTRLTSTNHTIGSPHYMSPEQLRGEVVDCRTDIYALGCTAYHMLAGKPPLAGKTISQIAALKLSGEAPIIFEERTDVSNETAALIHRMMAYDVESRPQDYDELLSAIDDLEPRTDTADMPRSGGDDPTWVPSSGRKDDATRRTAGPTNKVVALAEAITQPMPSIEPATGQQRKQALQRLPLLAAVAAAVLLAVVLGLSLLRHKPTRPLTATGNVTSLFDGHTFAPWVPLSGEWTVTSDDEGATVIAGKDGFARRSLPKDLANSTTDPSTSYRIAAIVRLREATAAEVQFGCSSEGSCSSVRLTKEGAELGQRKAGSSAFQPKTSLHSYPRPGGATHDVIIERQPADWWVFVDGKVIGTVRPDSDELPDVRLVAEGGPAWFSDLTIEALRAPK
jgi:eukaryotic-like serine/threonine-protein kinase